jgi:outer membrane protein
MPQLAIVEKQMSDLQQAYDAEMKRVEDDFNQKYEAFLDGRKDFPRTILLKRQTELQQLLQQNIEFKAQCRQEMEKARREAMVPLQGRLAEAIATVARRHKLALVVNTDANACPFIEPALALDLNDEVRQLLRRGR